VSKIERICKYCGKTFEIWPSGIKNGRGKYCSVKCQHDASKNKIKKNCETCDKEFYISPFFVKKGQGRFCSLKCYRKSIETKTEVICKNCGKSFKTKSYYVKRGGGKFCSRECYLKFKQPALIKKICKECGKEFNINPSSGFKGLFCSYECMGKFKRKRIIQNCKNCGKEFETSEWYINKGQGLFCSKKCRYEYEIGDKHHSWRGGISFEPYCPKFNDEFKERVRGFWGHKCGVCGKTQKENGKKLSIHHVNYKKMACCDNTPPIFIALCHSCHSKTGGNRIGWEYNLTEYIMIYCDGESYLPK
jgi:hypothetical protein